MPAPRTSNQWPLIGERSTLCTLKYAVESLDEIHGLADATMTTFGRWWAKVASVALVQDETKAPLLWQVEGQYRSDLEEYFNGTSLPTGVTAAGGLGIYIVTPLRTMKVIQVEHPLERRRTLIAHCAKAVN